MQEHLRTKAVFFLKLQKLEDIQMTVFEVLKENGQQRILYLAKIPFKKAWNKDFFKQIKLEIHYQHTCTTRNIKEILQENRALY